MNDQHFIWIDGRYIPAEQVSIKPLSQTFHYGFGVYEGLRSYETQDGPAIFRLEDHTNRLFQSAALLHIKIPYSKETINTISREIIMKNKLTNAYIRPVVFMGDEYLGLHTQKSSVHVMIATIKWNNFYMNPEKMRRGISIKTSSYERLALKNGLNKAKANGMYLISILANNEAIAAGCDEALMLDPHGYVAEGSGANLFMVNNNCLYTPFLHFALDGITRRTIIDIAQQHGITVIEKNITQKELYQADEIFFTGTAAEVVAITTLDDQQIATGSMGKLTETLQQHYSTIVTGRDEQYQYWLSYTQTLSETHHGI